MKISQKTLKNGFSMPVFGMGTWKMGGLLSKDTTNDEQDIKAIRVAIELRISLIDTAELYGDGHAEELVGEAIKDTDRKDLFLVSKVYKNHLSYADAISSCKATLKRLGTDYLDLYLVHAPNSEAPLSETFKALDQLKADGLIREIGVSNFGISELEESQKHTRNKIVVNQIHYNLAFQNLQEVVNYCQKNDILVMCYRPIERGALIDIEIPVIQKMCQKYKKTPPQVVMNWLISQDYITTISKMGNSEHIIENLGALNWKMDKEDIEFLRSEIPPIDLPETLIKFNK